MILEDTNQINQVMTNMYQAFQVLPIEAREFFFQKITEDMAQINNTSIYTLQVFKSYYSLLKKYGVRVQDASILELGAGKPLGTGIFWNFTGARKYTAIDRYNQVNLNDIWLSRFRDMLGMNLLNPNGFDLDALIQDNNHAYTINNDRIELIQGRFEDYPFAAGSFDFIYSHAALEHFADIEVQIRKMHQVLSNQGCMVHQIDLRQHNTDKVQVPDVNTAIEFLRYSPAEWASLYTAGSYHYVNRLRANDYEDLFIKEGFTIVESITNAIMDLDESVYPKIHPYFHRYSINDLSRTGIMLILKK